MKICVDCNKKFNYKGKRCHSCYHKKRMKLYKCSKCGKTLGDHRSKGCRGCMDSSGKNNSMWGKKRLSGKDHCNWKGGEYRNNCIDCGKPISRRSKRCRNCWFVNSSGQKHWNWKGGISCEPYCDVWLDKEYKESIKARDNYQCQNPDCWRTSKKLTIHHIDYNKKNCIPWNLITLCASCNSIANGNRKHYEAQYKAIINGKYSKEASHVKYKEKMGIRKNNCE